MKWTENDEYISYTGPYESNKIAAFDLDSTLVMRTKFGHEWTPLKNVYDILNKLAKKNFVIVIFTNQSGMSTNKSYDSGVWRSNFLKFSKNIECDVHIFAAKKHDRYRKPNIGMWSMFINTKELHEKSFYCGDASCVVSDHSDSDRKFAMNIGINFYVPGEIFEGKEEPKYTLGYDPFAFVNPREINLHLNKVDKPDMIIMIGYPASGKTTFCRNVLQSYEHINQDTLKTKQKCINVATKCISQKKNIVIDSLNSSVDKRQEYIRLAKDYNVRCIIMETPIELAYHLNNVRYMTGRCENKIPSIVYYSYRKNYEPPDHSEGIHEIIHVNPRIDFSDKEFKRQFYMYSESF